MPKDSVDLLWRRHRRFGKYFVKLGSGENKNAARFCEAFAVNGSGFSAAVITGSHFLAPDNEIAT